MVEAHFVAWEWCHCCSNWNSFYHTYWSNGCNPVWRLQRLCIIEAFLLCPVLQVTFRSLVWQPCHCWNTDVVVLPVTAKLTFFCFPAFFLCRMSCIGGCFYCYYLTRSHHSALSVAAAAVRKHHFSDRRVAHSIFNSKWSNLVTPYHVRFSKKMLRLELRWFSTLCSGLFVVSMEKKCHKAK